VHIKLQFFNSSFFVFCWLFFSGKVGMQVEIDFFPTCLHTSISRYSCIWPSLCERCCYCIISRVGPLCENESHWDITFLHTVTGNYNTQLATWGTCLWYVNFNYRQCLTLTLAQLAGASEIYLWASKTTLALAWSGNQNLCSANILWNDLIYNEESDW